MFYQLKGESISEGPRRQLLVLYPHEEFNDALRFSCVHAHTANKIADVANTSARREENQLSSAQPFTDQKGLADVNKNKRTKIKQAQQTNES